MKTQQFATLTAAAAVATTTVFGMTGAAQAYGFNSSGISFSKDTTVTFTMGKSHGSYISSLGIYEVNGSTPSKVYDLFWETKKSDNGNANGWMGTFGNTLTSATGSAIVTYKFLANKVYTLGLTSIEAIRGRAPRLVGTVFSTTSLNGSFGQGAVFSSTGTDGISNDGGGLAGYGNYLDVDPAEFNDLTRGAAISFDDGGNRADKDYNDFAFTAAVPEPLTMGGMALGAAGMAIARKRRNNNIA